MKKQKSLIILLALSFLFPLAVHAEAVTEIDLNSGAARSDTFVSVNELFETGQGTYQLIMYGLKKDNKDAFLQALSEAYDAQQEEALTIRDTPFADAEKFNTYPADERTPGEDSGLCWAASASNMLWMSGWAPQLVNPDTGSLFTSEDDVFAYYYDHFSNGGSDVSAGIDWFFMGEYYASPDHGGSAILVDPANSDNGLRKEFVSTFVQDHYDLTVDPTGIDVLMDCDWDSASPAVFQASLGSLMLGEIAISEHSVTCAGFIIDPQADSWQNRYKALIIINSDNDGIPSIDPDTSSREERRADKESRPNSITVFNITLSADINGTPFWQLLGYDSYEPELIYALNRLPLYDEGLVAQYTETEGNKSVSTTLDLTPFTIFTTDRTEVIRDLYRKKPEDFTVTEFEADEAINLSYFITNKGYQPLMQDSGLCVSWQVVKDSDQSVIAQGIDYPDTPLFPRMNMGYMIHLNQTDGAIQTWKPGSYTVYLDLNPDRAVTESYYLNNTRSIFRFTINGEEEEQKPIIDPDDRRPVPNTAHQ